MLACLGVRAQGRAYVTLADSSKSSETQQNYLSLGPAALDPKKRMKPETCACHGLRFRVTFKPQILVQTEVFEASTTLD